MISSISSFQDINVVRAERKFFFWITASVTDADIVKHNGIKTL